MSGASQGRERTLADLLVQRLELILGRVSGGLEGTAKARLGAPQRCEGEARELKERAYPELN